MAENFHSKKKESPSNPNEEFLVLMYGINSLPPPVLQSEYTNISKSRTLIDDVSFDFNLPDMTSLIRTVDNIKWMFVAQVSLLVVICL